jgi:branched-chain amino acid transport system permease protein
MRDCQREKAITMPTSEIIANMLVGGVLWGGIYALISLGLSLQYGVARVFNLSHGEFIMVGGFASISLRLLLGINPLLSLVIVGPGLLLIGFLLHSTLFRKLLKSSPSLDAFEGSSLLATFGLLYVVQYTAILIWGALPYQIPFYNTLVRIGEATIIANRLIAFAFGIGICLAFYFFLSRTRLGKAIRAAAQDPATAGLMGVNINRVLALCFGLGVALAGFAGVLHSMCLATTTVMGIQYTIIAIIVVVLGGLGSITGCVIGGFILGIVGNILAWTEPVLALPVFYVIFLILLLVRPTGILGKR